MKKIFRKKYLFIFILLILSFFGGLFLGQDSVKQKQKAQNGKIINKNEVPEYLSKDVNFKLFWEVWNLVSKNYIKQPVSETKLFYGALLGLVSSLEDPHSIFLDPEITNKFTQELSGSFEGIGAEIGIKKNQLTIISPLPASPAEKAGLRAGDKIMAIDKYDTTGIPLDLAVSKIRGKKGTQVVLSILREGLKESKDVAIVRGTIAMPTVKWEMKKNNIAYFKIYHFNEESTSKFDQAVRGALLKNPKAVILDLRNNPGGYLQRAVEVASKWIENGTVVIEKYGQGYAQGVIGPDGLASKQKAYKAEGKVSLKDFKTIILINEGSASASEIVAGALQDYGKAQLVGEKTFGKGSVQDLYSLKDGSSVKLTIAEWLTPKGRLIEKEGIKPDLEVKFTEDDYNNNKDPQLDKALELLSK